ncbi:hypothetical protein [Actinomycetospora aeridis]|uniref:Uncharacterized protein n=1 Tax=Actinomycetospora aeridis TaxID=3129231 RepID=A0ABU8N2F1_9PSEU
MVVELPLTTLPDRAWATLFEAARKDHPHRDIGWVHPGAMSEVTGEPVIRFRLLERDSLLETVDEIERAIKDASDRWVAEPAVAELIAKQQRIDALQGFLSRVAET